MGETAKADKLELKVRRAVALANELVEVGKVLEHCYATMWRAVFDAMIYDDSSWTAADATATGATANAKVVAAALDYYNAKKGPLHTQAGMADLFAAEAMLIEAVEESTNGPLQS